MLTSARGITRALLGLLLLALLVAVVGIAGFARLAPATGHPVLIIRSGSMVPTIPIGAAVVLSPGAGDLQPGDVVAMRLDNGAVFTHRITRLASLGGVSYIETKGDANRDVDPALTPLDHVIGRVAMSLPIAGFLIAGLSTPTGIASVLLAALALLVALWFLGDDAEFSTEPAPVGLASPGPAGSGSGIAAA
jgi:signal peptidase